MKFSIGLFCAVLCAGLSCTAFAQTPAPLLSDPIAADWKPIPDEEMMVITLSGNRTVVIRLASRFAPAHVANISSLARAHWWDGTSIYRVQDNYVVQWGDATEKKPLPAGVVPSPVAEFDIAGFDPAQKLDKADAYSTKSGFTVDGWPIATNGAAAWLTHCYGSVGVARNTLPDTGSGSELFTAIGPARRLDRNYTVVGRIIEGMQYLSALPRSNAPLGFYASEAERTPIVAVRLASDMPAAERPKFEYRSTDNPRFAALIGLRTNPQGLTSLGGIDVCDVPLATRRVPK
jgi:cyclophilin family peptidyl-prolyl cis-trans isomerase